MALGGEEGLGKLHRGGAEGAERRVENINSRELCAHEKKFKNDEIRKIGINEIKYLRVLMLAKIDLRLRGECYPKS